MPDDEPPIHDGPYRNAAAGVAEGLRPAAVTFRFG